MKGRKGWRERVRGLQNNMGGRKREGEKGRRKKGRIGEREKGWGSGRTKITWDGMGWGGGWGGWRYGVRGRIDAVI